MSAYRALTADDLERVRRLAGADALVDVQPIHAGIENSNWFITLVHAGRAHRCVLTQVQVVAADELPFFIALTDTLAEADLPVPMALRLADGRRQFLLDGRPALLVPRLPGTHVPVPDAALCRAVGEWLARLHHAAAGCGFRRERPDHLWWPTAFAFVAPMLDRAEHDRLAAALLEASRTFAVARDRAHALPQGLIHGDLFRDNVLLEGGEISGVLDFFHATHDVLAWDIAIALNDWAVVDAEPVKALADALLAGYDAVRPLTAGEQRLLPALRRAAAARFWLSRHVAAAMQEGADPATVQRKDPAAMRALWQRLAD